MYQSLRTPGPWKTWYLSASLRILLPILLSAAFRAEAQTTSPAGVDISNFGQINQDYYRGSQPDGAGFAQLKRMGIRTVIDLQEDGENREPVWVQEEGMQYFNIPLSSHRPATDAQSNLFLRLVNDPQNLPVYVHCAGGKHRTGEMTAIYRITHDTWTANQAYQEMKEYGFYSIGGHGPLKQYVYQYYSEHINPKPETASLETPALIRK